nr:ADP,ATP carrier protein, mitochondrial [Tanacetum cinerariifolium]
MTEPHSATTIKLANQLPLSQDVPSCYEKLIAANYSPIFVQAQAPSDKGLAGFAVNFLMGGVSKTVATPIESVKLLIHNQDEILKTGRLSQRYRHWRLLSRTIKDEGFVALWRGKTANVNMSFVTSLLR